MSPGSFFERILLKIRSVSFDLKDRIMTPFYNVSRYRSRSTPLSSGGHTFPQCRHFSARSGDYGFGRSYAEKITTIFAVFYDRISALGPTWVHSRLIPVPVDLVRQLPTNRELVEDAG
jgi:hypothetical protein